MVHYVFKWIDWNAYRDRKQFKGMESWNAIFNPLVTRPLTIGEVVLEGSCQNKT